MATQASLAPHCRENKPLGRHCMKRNADQDPQRLWDRKDASGLSQCHDDGLLVTNVNQTQDLLRLRGAETRPGPRDEDEAQDWLSAHSLAVEQLTAADLARQGALALEEGGRTEKGLRLAPQVARRFEEKLSRAIDLYEQRIQWLTENSKKAFGLVKGARVGVLVGLSAVGSGPGREEFQNNLMGLIDEQLSRKEKLYALSFGATTSALWPDPVDVSASTLKELQLWVRCLQPEGGSNLLQALKKAFAQKGLDSLVAILGSCPDQPAEILSDYIQQSTVGQDLRVHIVAYGCSDQLPPAILKNIAEAARGHYHCHGPGTEACTNADVDQLLAEIQKAQRLLGHVQALSRSTPGEELPGLLQEISTEIAKGPLRGLLPKPPKHEAPLTIEFPNLEKTSAEWLKDNGLKAKKLSLYQVLAPNAFSPLEEFVPILQRTVSSTVHKRAMVQFQWHDGTVKNVHVDLPFLCEYQKQLGRAMRQYEQRIEWLSLASRRVWGTVCEKRVVLLLDFSATNSTYIIHMQHAVRLLLEQQLANKDAFNVVAFGSAVESWRPELAPMSPDNLQSVWQWTLALRCGGSRDVLGALRKAVEVDFRDRDRRRSQGIYLFTGGIPDQDMPVLSAYMAEACGGCDLRLHVCLFHVGEPWVDAAAPAAPARYAGRADTAAAYRELVHAAGGGRFHWFGDTGIYESDDVSAIQSEMQKALDYSQKCALLVSSFKSQSRKGLEGAAVQGEKPKMPRQGHQPKSPGKTAAPSAARMV